MALAPNAVGPNLGAELLLDAEARPGVESMRAGLLQAGPLAAAGVLANGASVVLTVALARLLVAPQLRRPQPADRASTSSSPCPDRRWWSRWCGG